MGRRMQLMKERIAAVEVADPLHITFRLKRPWPDFLTFYTGATGAGWIVPRKYVERVGDDGFRKAPVGAGPYRFVSFNPGVELVLEAFEQYWRRPPARKARGSEGGAGRSDPAGSVEGRRAGHRLLNPRRAGRTIAANARSDAEAGGPAGYPMAVLPRAMGPQIALARRSGQAGGQPRPGPPDHQRSADAGPFAHYRQPVPRHLRVLSGHRHRRSTIRRRRANC